MESNIDTMIEDIYYREKQAEEQKSKLSKVRSEIYHCQEMIKGTQQHQNELRERIKDQGCRLQEDQSKLKCWTARYSALEDVKSQIKNQRLQVEKEKANLTKSASSEDESFYASVQNFMNEYDLVCDGSVRRENLTEKQIQENQKKKERIEKELCQVRLHQTAVKDLQWTLDTTKRLIRELERRRNQLEEDVSVSEARVRQLLDEKETLADLPQRGPEYLQLQAELRTSNVSMKRDEYIQLQERLAELRRNVDHQ